MINTLKPLDNGNKIISPEEAMKMLEGYQPPTQQPPNKKQTPSNLPKYIEAHTYAQAAYMIRGLQNPYQPKYTLPDGSKILRPLTFRETLQEIVNDFETLNDSEGNPRSIEERIKINSNILSTCTGIAHKANSPKFKIIPLCEQLITIPIQFNDSEISINYDSLPGIELDITKAKYEGDDEQLTKKEVLNHPAWNAAVEEDRKLLEAYSKIVFDTLKQKKAMAFCVSKRKQDELSSLFISRLDYDSEVIGGADLNDGICLLLAHNKHPQ